MGKINLLSFEIANLIAAGEVVERPASVLKELIENSIDAGAKNITAEIKRGGVSLIRVSDDGCGIDKADLPIALKRHATSKISEKDDLASIMTLGFRGEALAAISSVSEVTIISKTRENECGYMLTSEAGVVSDVSEVMAADGTTVVVSNLFYNVPARRKFLKKDATEAMNVAALVERVALSHPQIAISLLIDGEERFSTPGDGELMGAIYAVLGRDFAGKLIEVSGEADGVKVHGYIGRSDNVRKNRNLMNVFINGRYVKSLTAQAAIEKAYTSYIAPECFPTCVLFIEMHPSLVDVNVHPAKLEVKFSDERIVFEAVYHTVRSALERYQYRPEMELKGKKEVNYKGAFMPIGEGPKAEQLSFNPPPFITERRAPSAAIPKKDGEENNSGFYKSASFEIDKSKPDRPLSFSEGLGESRKRAETGREMSPEGSISLLEKFKKITEAKNGSEPTGESLIRVEGTATERKPQELVENTTEKRDYRIIGEAFDCYVFVQRHEELLVIDKHAAHERIIFEELRAQREGDGRVASQALILPICTELNPDELSVAEANREELFKVGFDFNINGRVCDITAIPGAISASYAEELFCEMVGELLNGVGTPEGTEALMRERALYQIACKAAIKGGRKYGEEVISWLVDKLMALPDITVCPHGRPVAYKLTKRELDRQFDRIK